MNEQKFLTELSKLLTFMYEEDRQVALSMYEQMFSFADDETAETVTVTKQRFCSFSAPPQSRQS